MSENTQRAAYYRGDKTFSVELRPAEAPGLDEVAVRIGYCGICGTDLHVYHGNMDARVGFSRIIGHEMSGTVEALGEQVRGFTIGQKVVVRPLDHCGECPACKAGHKHICHNLKFLGLDTDGAMQEVWNVPAHTLHPLPDELQLDHAALIEPLAVACHDVQRAEVAAGENVLVIGGGPIGLLVALVAREAGGNVVISEINDIRLAYAGKLGFNTIDPKSQDPVHVVNEMTNGKGADVVFEVSGSQPGVDLMTAAAAARARIVMVAIHAKKPEVDMFQFFWRELELLGARVYQPEDYDEAIRLLTEGVVDCASFITDIRPLEQIQSAFEALTTNPEAIKSMIRISKESDA
ncbi:alcohol dehydrogenase catalytic domain-containing protein [uncultured Roseibium sp.]|uniref:zinc-dependent alcohol dehydrogenase n=1 Tax=uncultured Roseibium sp. TaxID=1936171 RepID=UPI002608ADE5|nr:alcohol dehydrogenase catalytic domain-containing protein [uncultured Roseibium sp.]